MIKTTQMKNSDGKQVDIRIAPLPPRKALALGYDIINMLKTLKIDINKEDIKSSIIDIRKTVSSLMRMLPYEKFESIIMQLLENTVVGKMVVDKDNFDAIFTGEFALMIDITIESFIFNFEGVLKNNLFSAIKKKIAN
jgi:hypothetical protein